MKYNMKNKKAWIRIVEALIGIMIIMSAVLFLVSKQTAKSDISEEVYEKQRQILEAISNNEEMRKQIIEEPEEDKTKLADAYILKNLPNTWASKTIICDIDKICAPEEIPTDRDIYVSETIISATLTNYQKSSKLMFFIWRK